MKTKVLQENFSKALAFVSRFSSSRAQLPVLANILLKASKTKLTISATNLEISASTSIGAQTETEGEITVPSRIITELVNSLSPGTITLEVEHEQLKIKTESFASTVLGMGSTDFPTIPQAVDAKKAEAFPFDGFKNALSQVYFAASADETRPTLTGILLVSAKNGLTLVATDGFRLSQSRLSVTKNLKEGRVILPKNILLEVSRLESASEELLVFLNKEEKQVLFGVNETTLSSRLIEGEFPSFEKIIPKEGTTTIVLEKEEFARAVRLAAVFARESANIIKIHSAKGGIKVSAESSSAGSQETAVAAKVEGDEVEIAFNYRFLEDLLHAVGGEEIAISLSGASSPAVFTDPQDTNFLHLIMPVRIQG